MRIRRTLLAALVIAFSLAIATTPFVGVIASAGEYPDAVAAAACGVERWPVKTLSDPREYRVRYTPRETSVNRLRSLVAPDIGEDTPRIDGVETTNYRVRAEFIRFKFEEDRDVHLVIGAPSAPRRTMIVEFPDPSCPGVRSSPKKAAMGEARGDLIDACGRPPSESNSFANLDGRATITGVGFFDIKHGQTGVAPNGIELHPVLRFADANCER